jgi:hypothetical protein
MKRATTSTTSIVPQKKSKKNLYIRVLKNALNFQGSRESVPVENFDLDDCSPQGLIIPLFSRTAFGKCRKSDGYPTDICVRYQGVLDMDMAMGIFNDEVIPPFTVKMGKQKAKMELCGYIKQNGLEKCIKNCKPFGDLYRVCVKVTNELKSQNKKYLFFYTGGKGFRILWHDNALYQAMGFHEQSAYAQHLVTTVFPSYFTCGDEIQEYIDKNVYEINKGIKPDIDKHIGTGLYPCEIGGDVNTLDVRLVAKIKSFWTEVIDNVPTEWIKDQNLIFNAPERADAIATNTMLPDSVNIDEAFSFAQKLKLYPTDAAIENIAGCRARIKSTKCPFGVIHNSNRNSFMEFKGTASIHTFQVNCLGNRCRDAKRLEFFTVGCEPFYTPYLNVKYSHIGPNGTIDQFPGSPKRYELTVHVSKKFEKEILSKITTGISPVKDDLLTVRSKERPKLLRNGQEVSLSSVKDEKVMLKIIFSPTKDKTYTKLLEVHVRDNKLEKTEETLKKVLDKLTKERWENEGKRIGLYCTIIIQIFLICGGSTPVEIT